MAAVTFTSNAAPFIAKMRESIEDGLKRAAKEIQEEAVSLAPVRDSSRAQMKFRRHASLKPAEMRALSRGTKSFGGTMRFKKNPFTVGADMSSKRPMTRTKPILRKAEYAATLRARAFSAKIGAGGEPEFSGGKLNSRGRSEQRDAFKGMTPEKLASLKPGATVGSRKAVTFHGMLGKEPLFEVGGYLRRNIVVGAPEGSGAQMKVSVVSKAPYSRYVEFPTRRTKAQPFMMPAIKQAKSNFRRAMKDAARAATRQG
jgi:HK97 gp10 family phage protein